MSWQNLFLRRPRGAHAVAVSATLVTEDGAFNPFNEWIITENWVAR